MLLLPAVAAHLSSGLTDVTVLSVVILSLRLLLPVAVLWGVRADANSNRALIGAAMVWTWLSFLIRLVPGWHAGRFDMPTGGLMDDLPSAIALVIGAAAYFGPLLIVLELARRRSSAVAWPRLPAAAAALAVAALAIWQLGTSLDLLRTTSLDGSLSGRDWLSAIDDAVRDVAILPVAALAWASLSAVRAKETPTRFWLCLVTGSALMLAVAVLGDVASLTISGAVNVAGGNPSDELINNVTQAQEVVNVVLSIALSVGWVFVLRAFASGVPGRRVTTHLGPPQA